jgi:cell division septal protein FtsQ
VLPARRGLPELGRLAPSGRSVLIGLVLFVLAVGAYFVARQSSLFAVRTVDVRGGTPRVRAEVRAALADVVGTSLLRVDGGAVGERLAAVPDVLSFHYDRSFPHTLRVVVRPEHAVLVLRRQPDSFLVSATGRVLRKLPHPRLSSLPRFWVPKQTHVAVGDTLTVDTGAAAAAALSALRSERLPQRVRVAVGGRQGLALKLSSGLELRLGGPGDLRLKLAIARRILGSGAADGATSGYLDVSVPERPVLNVNPRLAG